MLFQGSLPRLPQKAVAPKPPTAGAEQPAAPVEAAFDDEGRLMVNKPLTPAARPAPTIAPPQAPPAPPPTIRPAGSRFIHTGPMRRPPPRGTTPASIEAPVAVAQPSPPPAAAPRPLPPQRPVAPTRTVSLPRPAPSKPAAPAAPVATVASRVPPPAPVKGTPPPPPPRVQGPKHSGPVPLGYVVDGYGVLQCVANIPF